MLCGSLDGRGVWRKWIHLHVWICPFPVHLKPLQHCLLISYTPIQNKKLKNKKTNKFIWLLSHLFLWICYIPVSYPETMYAFMLSLFNHVRFCATPWTVAHQAPLCMGILQARILEWVAMPSSRGSSRLRIEPRSPMSQADSLLSDLT